LVWLGGGHKTGHCVVAEVPFLQSTLCLNDCNGLFATVGSRFRSHQIASRCFGGKPEMRSKVSLGQEATGSLRAGRF
jgi:hypothetical protein